MNSTANRASLILTSEHKAIQRQALVGAALDQAVLLLYCKGMACR